MRAVIVIVILLFSVVTFNAYACLVPLPSSSLAMGKNCPSPQEEQTPQWCDVFKTLSVESTISLPNSQHCKAALAVDPQGIDLNTTPTFLVSRLDSISHHQFQQPSSHLFLKLSTLRI